ncbi:HNH endonuclease family protein [Haloferula sp.]|uniref:HNH endonuclease family protein n=1 Tax=Haloferula sp. TaxID=2497595 RepID=UPI003C757A12
MEISKKPWPILSVCSIKDRIDTNPDFQRPAVWSRGQKQLLIDTILRGYDIPKLYWRKIASKPDRYDVVDGQQRLRTVFEFQSGDFRLSKDADPIDGEEIAGIGYSDLPDDLRLQFENYALDVIVLTETDEDEVREMFLRLQNGTTLKAQEKRNAMPGRMRDAVKSLVDHEFFTRVAFKNSRFTHDLVAAQMIAIELNGGPCHIRDSALNRMYEEQKDFDISGSKAKKVKRVLSFLASTFPEKTPELERYSVISLYALVSHCMERYAFAERETELHDWFLEFEIYRRTEMKRPEEERDSEVIAYKERTSHSTDAQDSIQWRHEFLLRKFFEAVPDIRIKDNQRTFTHEQRLAMFRRNKGCCQLKIKCQGEKCEWDNWHADHIKPWSKGGPTTVENGQVACAACNTAKGVQE